MPVTNQEHPGGYILRMHPLQRIAVSAIISISINFVLSGRMPVLMNIMLVWDVFSLCYLILSWIVIVKRPVPQIRKMAKKDDGSAVFVFVLILISSLAGMFTILLLMLSQKSNQHTENLYLPVAVSGLMLSWAMVHSIYTFHYAHMYYDDDKKHLNQDAHGLEFPGDEKPTYIDFAYFSFVIGCTFQVSDVEISSPKIRRVVLFHGLLSFALNTFVVALTINIIAGLSN